MSLAPVLKYPPVVWLVPSSGVQFLDFGFRLQGNRDLPTQWAFWDDGAQPAPLMVARGGDTPAARVSYDLDQRRIAEMLDRTWVPLPILKREKGGGHARGPINWARAQLARLDAPDADGNDHRLVLAFDTNLDPRAPDQAYLAPAPEDTQRGDEFSLAADPAILAWYAGQNWVRDWCRLALVEMIRSAEAKRMRAEPVIDEAMIADRIQGPREDVARYLALIDLIGALKILPSIRLVDRVTQPQPTPIEVDLVLDVGNSRTCGLMVETHPDESDADVTQAVKLTLRDLGRPTEVYGDPFDSRLEFSRASFGPDDLSFLSGRSNAFSWPTVARVGAEAQRLSSQRRGSEGATGMSSPKRYLWDQDARRDGWRFNTPADRWDEAGFATGVEFTTLINDMGEPLSAVPPGVPPNDEQRFPSIRALYSRSSLMTIALAEVFLQALAMMNSPNHRLRRRNAQLPRRLARIIMTMPTGMALAELQILRRRAAAARDLVYQCLDMAEPDPGTTGMRATPGHILPEIIIEWDEASATQATYLYSQIAMGYSGDARGFFAANRLPMNRADPDLGDDFRLATLDIGGGTTDLVITAYTVEGEGANVTLFPRQILREGISLAGDDVVFQIVVEHVLEPIRRALLDSPAAPRADFLMHQLFGGDRGDIDVADQLRRQQFAAHVGAPLALMMIAAYESWTPGSDEAPALTLASLGPALNPGLIAALDREIRREGAPDFSLTQVRFPVDLAQIDRTARSVLQDVLQALAEVTHRARADLMILSGRPSRMPAAYAILAEACALPPHRIEPLHDFTIGQWYPFRGYDGRILDPKTTAAVGAMICLLGAGRLKNFNYRSDHLRPRSTARYFGKLDQDARLREGNVFLRDLDLDNPDYDLPEIPIPFRGPMTLGTRQFAVDWWPGARLYTLDYANPEAAERRNAKAPFAIELRRAMGRDNPGVVDAFAIGRVTDADGATVSPRDFRLRLQTIGDAAGYWLDTGILLRT